MPFPHQKLRRAPQCLLHSNSGTTRPFRTGCHPTVPPPNALPDFPTASKWLVSAQLNSAQPAVPSTLTVFTAQFTLDAG